MHSNNEGRRNIEKCPRRHLDQSPLNQRGQVAIFVALVFQVLFVFFAMVVNIGLLVHHKINLQNSVDLAAYYGAMKQAEVLNAIAHVNYQIRQSWKLMVFRHRHMGMMGDAKDHPLKEPIFQRVPRGPLTDEAWPALPAFCMGYPPYTTVAADENPCKEMVGISAGIPREVRLPKRTGFGQTGEIFSSVLGGIIDKLNASVEKSKSEARDICKNMSQWNYLFMARFILAHKTDVANRKRLIFALGNGLSNAKNDFIDLDGESASAGVLETLKRNLTYQNVNSLDPKTGYEFFNSMGAESCQKGGTEIEAPRWLSEINIRPLYGVVDVRCGGENVLAYYIKYLNSGNPLDITPEHNEVDIFRADALAKISQYVQEQDGLTPVSRLYKSTIGFEKDPWCMSYVRVKASTQPKIPFMPMSDIKITAQAFAKPFGGTIGPWDKTPWAKETDSVARAGSASAGTTVDSVRPPRVPIGDATITPDQIATMVERGPDFARYVGDKVGSSSLITVFQYAKEFYTRFQGQNASMAMWDHLLKDKVDHLDDPASPGDILAWDSINNQPAQPMRNLENAVISPDQFDMAYYSIEPDFYRNYLLRLRGREKNKFSFNVRGDLGSRKGGNGTPELERWSVKDQIRISQGQRTAGGIGCGSGNYFQVGPGSLGYYVDCWPELLTSYQSKTPELTTLDEDRFGKCKKQVEEEWKPLEATFGNCVEGGRTGYSVKLVDGEFLKRQNVPLGGPGTSGEIRNPWWR